MVRFLSTSISSSCMFFCFQLFSIVDPDSQLKICMGTKIAKSSRNCLPAHCFHLLPGAGFCQIFRNLPNVLWEPSLQESCHDFGLSLPTTWSPSWLFTSPVEFKALFLSRVVHACVGLVSLKYFFPSKMCLFCI